MMSAIRIVEAFHVDTSPAAPSEISGVMMQLLVNCKFPHDDESTHEIRLMLRRPNGEEKDVQFANSPLEVRLKEMKPPIPNLPRGFNLVVPWGVIAAQVGAHELFLLVDGEVAATSIFTLAPRPVSESEL